MRRFGKNIFWTTLVLAVWATAMNSVQVQNMKNSVPDGKTILVIGDSHSTGFQGPNLLNLSKNGEPLPTQVDRALCVLEKGTYKTIVCAIGPQTASSEPQRLMNNERNWLSGNQNRISLIAFDQPHIIPLLTPKANCYQFLNLFNWNKREVIKNRFDNHGAESDLSEKRTRKRLNQLDIDQPNWYCDSTRFFKSILLLSEACRKSAASLQLIELPYHDEFRNQIHQKDYQKFKTDINRFCILHNHVSYTDFSDSNYPNDHFSDADHLNKTGFQRFMREEFPLLTE